MFCADNYDRHPDCQITGEYDLETKLPKEGKFLKFNDFAYIISKIKKLSYQPKYYSVVLNDPELLESLSPRTRSLVEGETATHVVDAMTGDYRKAVEGEFATHVFDTRTGKHRKVEKEKTMG